MRFRLFPFRSPLLRESMFLSFPAGTKMFQFPAFAPSTMVYSLQLYGFPHSDISGSSPVCRSPELFAAYHVLLRFRKPRHPPFALVLFLFCESLLRLKSLKSIILVCLIMKLQSLQLEKTLIISDYNLFYLVISLSIVKDLKLSPV